ncbi:hypothetical protein B0H11DRAFT_1356045 [Mycena galericulata]|nr:hypothetical protein B0H11DRAFT_1356045 [Mycena galericulata]
MRRRNGSSNSQNIPESGTRISSSLLGSSARQDYMPRFSTTVRYLLKLDSPAVRLIIGRASAGGSISGRIPTFYNLIRIPPCICGWGASSTRSTNLSIFIVQYFSQDAIHYLEPLVGIRALAIIYSESTAWIRRSAGRLCVELSNTSGINFADYPWTQPPLIPISVRRGEHESAIISTLTLEQYHQTCFTYFKKRSSAREDTRNHNIRLGAVHCSGGDGDGDQEIAHVRNFLAPDSKLVWERRTGNRSLVVIDNGWTRFTLPCDEKIGIDSSLRLSTPYDWDKLAQRWLSQANYIFRQYPITAPYEDYALVSHIKYRLKLLAPSEIHPEGYLFLCPPEDLKSEDGGFIERPECPAYWSLDPSGSERLSPEEAFAHGFPSFEWQRTVDFWSWDEWVYAGLSQFHAGKGFDPYSQDIAQHLGYPLHQLSRVPAPVGAHIEEISPEPDVGTPATITDVNPLEHDDDCLIAEQNHQQTDPTVSGIAGQKTEQIDQRLAARNFRLITVGALGIVLALLLAYLCSL